ncbi:MAG: biotin/lipoyl-containing protein, partial [Bacteroidota bacterium]
MIDIKVPTVGESINEVTLLKWAKNDGDYVERDEVIAELESEKATFEVNAEKAGVLKTNAKEGDTLKIGDVLASIDENGAKPDVGSLPVGQADQKSETEKSAEKKKTEPKSSNGQEKKALKKEAQTSDLKPHTSDVKATPVASAMIAD